MKFRLAILLLALSWPSLGHPIVIRHDVDDARYRGDQSAYKFIFALYKTKAGLPDCIATLIAPQWAITAAHCTQDKVFLDALAQARPSYPVTIGDKAAIIDRVQRHPDRADGRKVDIALLHLSRPVVGIYPVAVYTGTDEVGRVVILPGWGQPGNGLTGLSAGDGRFRVAENRVDAARDGLLAWVFDDPRSGIGRALPLEGVSGPGDSGGPALIMTTRGWATIGISMAQRTFGRPEGQYNAEEIYARLSDYTGWIDQIIGPS